MKNKVLAELLGIFSDKCPIVGGKCMPKCRENDCDRYYPDFTEPENFVKLLELVFYYTGSIEYFQYAETESLTQQVLDDIRDVLEDNSTSPITDGMLYKIKEQAQQVKWRY